MGVRRNEWKKCHFDFFLFAGAVRPFYTPHGLVYGMLKHTTRFIFFFV